MAARTAGIDKTKKYVTVNLCIGLPQYFSGIRHFSSESSALQHVRFCINIPQRRVHYTNPLVYSTLPGWPRRQRQYIILSLNKERDGLGYCQ